MNKKTVNRSLWAAVAALFVVASVQATSLRPINLAETVETSEKAFQCEIISSEVVQLSNGWWADRITAQVSTAVRGDVAAGEVITWNQARQSEELRIVGMPVFNAGDEYVIFLSGKTEGYETQSPMGLGQGAFRVHRNRETGEAYVRNAFMNRHLMMNLDVRAIAEVQVGREIAEQRRVVQGVELQREIVREQSKITQTTHGASDLDSFLRTVETLDSVENPTEHFYRDSAEDGAMYEQVVHVD